MEAASARYLRNSGCSPLRLYIAGCFKIDYRCWFITETCFAPFNSIEVTIQVVFCVLVHAEDMEVVSVDLNVATHRHVSRGDPIAIFVDVLVLFPFEELSMDDARVLLIRFVDANAVISQVEGDDKAAIYVLRHTCIESRSESQDLGLVVQILEEVGLGAVRHQLVDITQRVFFLAHEWVVRDDLGRCD